MEKKIYVQEVACARQRRLLEEPEVEEVEKGSGNTWDAKCKAWAGEFNTVPSSLSGRCPRAARRDLEPSYQLTFKGDCSVVLPLRSCVTDLPEADSPVPAPLLDQLRTWDRDESALRALLLWDAAHDLSEKKESLKRPRDECATFLRVCWSLIFLRSLVVPAPVAVARGLEVDLLVVLVARVARPF